MIKVHKEYSLRQNTTFGVESKCAFFAEPGSEEEIRFLLDYISQRGLDTFIIGEGSNLLFANDFSGMIIHPNIRGIQILDESLSEVRVKVGAGENWDSFVDWAVTKKYYGVENLSLIPGSVGAAPVQNIGAYGVEAKEIIEEVEVIDTDSGEKSILANQACEFGYRDSIFKHANKNKYLVTKVVFRLRKKESLELGYGRVRQEFEKNEIQDLASLRETIIKIREEKLPNPESTGNAGSFFKNPLIDMIHFQDLQQNWKEIPSYPAGADKVKVPAAWLIEQSGWKGKRIGDAGTWPSQPLVLVNYGSASGKEILNLAQEIIDSVANKFKITLVPEVLVI